MERFRMPLLRAAALGLLVVATSAAGSVGSANAAGSPCGQRPRPPAWRHIVVIAFENHSYRQILGSSAPGSYFKTLASECGSATAYRAVHFPRSLPNYMAATGGAIVTPTDCQPGPDCSSAGANIFSQVGATQWRTFAESMPRPCDLHNGSLYVPRHAPAPYYRRVPRTVCARNMVALPSHPLALRRAFTWIAPNLNHDMHNGSPAQASTWLQGLLGGPSGLLHSRPYTKGHTAIFIWFDSAGASGSVRTAIPFIVISPSTPARRVAAPLDHYSALRGWESMLGVHCVAAACDVKGIRRPFNL
jgi:phosphatidylinositol-3-phosphatase